MSKLVEALIEAQNRAMAVRPAAGGFPVLAEVLRRAGVRMNRWSLPSCQSIYVMGGGSVVQQGTPLVVGMHEIPAFDRSALIAAIRSDQEGHGTFPAFLQACWGGRGRMIVDPTGGACPLPRRRTARPTPKNIRQSKRRASRAVASRPERPDTIFEGNAPDHELDFLLTVFVDCRPNCSARRRFGLGVVAAAVGGGIPARSAVAQASGTAPTTSLPRPSAADKDDFFKNFRLRVLCPALDAPTTRAATSARFCTPSGRSRMATSRALTRP